MQLFAGIIAVVGISGLFLGGVALWAQQLLIPELAYRMLWAALVLLWFGLSLGSRRKNPPAEQSKTPETEKETA